MNHGDDPEDDNEVLVVNYNKEGTIIVSGSYNTQLKVWDSSTGERLKTLFCGDEILDAKLSDDGNKIVILVDILDEDGGEIIIWDFLYTIPLNGEEEDNIFHLIDENGPEHMYVTCMDLNQKRIITGEIDEDDSGFLCYWDLDSRQLLHKISLEGDMGNEVRDVKFNANGTKIVTSSEDNKVRIWSTETWVCILTIDLDIGNKFGHPYTFFNVCFSPDGTKIACSTYNNHFIRVFNSEDGNEIIYYMHDRVVHSVKFSPDNKNILFLDDGGVYVWDLFTDIEQKRTSNFRMGVMPLQRDEPRQFIDNKAKQTLAIKDISNKIMQHVSGGKSNKSKINKTKKTKTKKSKKNQKKTKINTKRK